MMGSGTIGSNLTQFLRTSGLLLLTTATLAAQAPATANSKTK